MEMDIANDNKIIEWLNNIEAKESTRKGYIRFMEIYCECTNKTPSELIQESIEEIKKGLLPAERNVSSYISKFKNCMNQKGYAPKSFHYGIAAIRSFYKAYDIPLPASAVKTKKPMPLKENNRFISKDDIIKLLTNAKNLREKAIILCMSTSGMARQEIINLNVQDIQFDDNGIGTISVRREKAQVDYTTFISPEATQALKAYWEERGRKASRKDSITLDELRKRKFSHAEDVVRQRKEFAKVLKLTPKSPAFVTYEAGNRLNATYFAEIFHTMGNELGYDDGEGFVKTRSHALRKFFASTLENAGMPKNKIDFMLGHTPSGNDQAYFRTDVNKLKELYIKFLPYIAFEKTMEIRSLDTKDAERLEELENENTDLRKRIRDVEKELDSRKPIDDQLGKLLNDPEFLSILKRKMGNSS
jgi:integrase